MVFPFDLLAHYLRSIVLIEDYSQNCEVLFQSSPAYNSYLVEREIKHFECASFNSKKVMECARKFDFSWLNYDDILKVYSSQLEAVKKVNPDIIIGDTSPTLKMVSEKLGIKYYSLKNIYLSEKYAFPRKLSITHPGHIHLKKLPPKFADSITSFVEKIAFKQVQKPFNKVRKKENLKKLKSYIEETGGDINLYCDDQKIFPLSSKTNDEIVIPPLLFDPKQDESEIIKRIQNGKPTICVTMGSSGDWTKLAFLNNFEYDKYNIITGGDLNNVICSENTISSSFLSLKEVLPYTDLLICHGGNGTIYHGVYNNIYMLCMTSHFEQEWNVHALERNNLGTLINQVNQSEIYLLIEKHIAKKRDS